MTKPAKTPASSRVPRGPAIAERRPATQAAGVRVHATGANWEQRSLGAMRLELNRAARGKAG
jgi:hypothetical protein